MEVHHVLIKGASLLPGLFVNSAVLVWLSSRLQVSMRRPAVRVSSAVKNFIRKYSFSNEDTKEFIVERGFRRVALEKSWMRKCIDA